MNPRLRSLFPRGSKSFFEANETETDHQLPGPKPERDQAAALDRAIPRKEKVLGRITLRYCHFRVRPLDFENVAGATKDCTDGLCRCGLLLGDDPTQVTIIVEQRRVAHFAEERIELEIEWPE